MSYQAGPPPYPPDGNQAGGYPPQQPYNQGGGYPQQYNQSGPVPVPPPPPRFNPSDMGAGYDTRDPEAPKTEFGFSDATIRRGFIKKVFTLLFIMLGVVCVMVGAMWSSEDAKRWVSRSTGGLITYIVSYVVFLVVYIALICVESLRRNSPTNLIMTAILTIAIGYMTAMITARYDVEIVLMTAVICVVCCGAIIVFAMFTKIDLTVYVMLMVFISMGLFVFGIIAVLVMVVFHSKIMYLVYAGLAALVFMVFLAIDVQMIMGGKRHELSPEEYVLAAIMLFLDIVYIFWMLLSLIGVAHRARR